MKKAILFTLAAIGFSANASYYQSFCSNGEGTVKIAEGHNTDFKRLTERKWNGDGTYTDTLVEGGMRHEFTDDKEMHSETKTSCGDGDEYGLAFWVMTIARKVTIVREDGSLFSKDTIGVSEDLKSVHAYVICQEEGNSDYLCEEN